MAKSKTTPKPVPIDRNTAVNVFGNVAQTNYYLVSFSGFGNSGPLGDLSNHLKTKFDVNLNEILANTGLMCSEATLPGSSLATAEVKDNFMGISQEFAHTRLYTDIDFTFYIDSNYNNLRFFEGWIDYIASASETLGPIGDGADIYSSNYYRRMRYPDSYKCSSMFITKFERDVQGPTITYQFINAFPKLVTAVPVSYGGADVLRVSVSFNYDRYIVNPTASYKTAPPNTFDPESGRAMYKPASENATTRENVNTSLAKDTSKVPTVKLANTGSGKDGNAGTGTYGNLMPSNPQVRSVTTQAEIEDKRKYGNTVPAGSFGITKKTKKELVIEKASEGLI